MLRITTPIAEWDVGPMMPGVCTVVGCVIIPLTILAWWLTLRKRRQRATVWAWPIIVTAAFMLWLGFGIDECFFEPHIDDTLAESLIEQQPEVSSYLAGQPQRWCKEQDTDHRPLDEAFHTIESDVGESDKVRRRFRVNLIDSSISTFDATRGWIPLDDWRHSGETRIK